MLALKMQQGKQKVNTKNAFMAVFVVKK